MNDWILDVSGLNDYVAQVLSADSILRSLRLRGEISGFKAYPSGHWYFTLKDERCRISCVMFRSNAMRMSFRPHEGDAVILHGNVRLYEEGGTYQFVADSMRPEGVGTLYQRFERLKAKLQQEGLFDIERKRPLPARPKKIAVVTSEAGAVLHDICKVAGARDPGVAILLLPVPVQGDDAAPLIAQAIRTASQRPDIDLIITGRGGGSIEDLWAFNEEIVARAIAESPVPVISAVGHETDFTIADFVADVRASTPSNAAEMAVPDRREIREAFHIMTKRFDTAAAHLLSEKRVRLLDLQQTMQSKNPEILVEAYSRRTEVLSASLERLMDEQLIKLKPRIHMASIRLDNATDRLLADQKKMLDQSRMKLQTLNPMRTLERGYAFVTSGEKVISKAADAPQQMVLHFSDGTVAVQREE